MELIDGMATVEDLDAFLADLDAVADEHGVTVQAFDARYVVSREHLERAVELADRAIARDENVAHDRGVEILCYVAARRQINRAFEVGVAEGELPLIVLVDAPAPATRADVEAAVDDLTDLDVVEPADVLGEYDPARVREFFDVGERELAVVDGDLPDVVLERVALLDVEK